MIEQALKFWREALRIDEIMRDNEHKKLARLKSEAGLTFYLKAEKHIQEEIERVCHFANELSAILPTPLYLKTTNNTYTVNVEGFIFTLESSLNNGNEIEAVTDGQIVSIAKALARMHNYCESKQIRLKKATSWGMFGGNQSDALTDYDENELSFLDFKKTFSHFKDFAEIEEGYLAHRKKLHALWPNLPKFATQGDFCYYNMWFNEHELVGVCDFNLAGDEVYVNEYMALAVYYGWHAKYEGTSSGEKKYKLFTNAYESMRKLNQLELQAKPLLYKIIRAFRFDRVDEGIENVEAHKQFIEQTKKIIS